MSSDIGIRVQVEGASAAAGELDKVGESAGKLGKSAEDSAGGIGGLKDALAAAGFLKVAAEVKELIDQGDVLNDMLAQLGGRSIEAARDVTQGLIPAMALAGAENRLLAANIRVTDEQFAAVSAAAQVFAMRTGTDGASALAQLTGALVAGNARGLRPFGIALREGQTGAEGTAEAIRQLSSALSANTENIERNTGAWDRAGAAWDTGKEKLGTLEAGIVDTIAAAHKLLLEIVKLPVEVARLTAATGDASSGFHGLADAAENFANALPFIGQEVGRLTAQIRGLLGVQRQVANFRVSDDVFVEGRAGGALSVTDTSTDYGRPRNRAEYAEQQRRIATARGLLSDGGQGALLFGTESFDPTQRRRGGGGGGARDRQTIEEALNGIIDSVDRFIDRLEEARQRAEEDERRSGGLFGITDDEDRADRNRDVAPGFNAEGRGTGGRGNLGGARNASQQVSAFARQTEAAQKYGGALEALKNTGVGALGALQGAIESNVAAWVAGEQSIGQALAGILSQTLTTIATEATVKALLATAEGLFLTATMKYDGAAAAFAAAGTYAAVAVLAGGGAAAMSAASGGGGGARRSSGSTARANGGAVRDTGGSAATMIQQFILSPGTGLEGPRHLATQLRRSDLQERRQRNIRTPIRVR
ncbi:MAG: hypothetical protein IT374_26310 [Polyangiaceae bacterium]|nr:hypothetical protein [Polyangiaceae bacterium]